MTSFLSTITSQRKREVRKCLMGVLVGYFFFRIGIGSIDGDGVLLRQLDEWQISFLFFKVHCGNPRPLPKKIHLEDATASPKSCAQNL